MDYSSLSFRFLSLLLVYSDLLKINAYPDKSLKNGLIWK